MSKRRVVAAGVWDSITQEISRSEAAKFLRKARAESMHIWRDPEARGIYKIHVGFGASVLIDTFTQMNYQR